MPDYCTCGAELPPDARFCHKCGKPQREEPLIEDAQAPTPVWSPPVAPEPVAEPVPIGFRNAFAVRACLIAAPIAVFLTMLFELASPLWLFAAGFLAARLYRRRTGQRLTLETGLRLGWMAGLVSFVIHGGLVTVSMILVSLTPGLFERTLRERLRGMPVQGGDIEQVLSILQTPAGMALFLLFSLFVLFVVFTMFAVMGGALSAKLARQD